MFFKRGFVSSIAIFLLVGCVSDHIGNLGAINAAPNPPQPPNSRIPASYFGLTTLNFKKACLPRFRLDQLDLGMFFRQSIGPTSILPQGVLIFTNLDSWVALSQAKGNEMLYDLFRTPQWASSQPTQSGADGPGECAPPTKMADWDAWVTAVVTHVQGKIKYWELANEPNELSFYCGTQQQMVTLAQHASQIIKSIDPMAKLVGPASSPEQVARDVAVSTH